MNPNQKTGLENVYGNFGFGYGDKLDSWHGDIESALAEFEADGSSKSTCENTR